MNFLDIETRQTLTSTVAIQSICHAVKELVENSIDACSTRVKIIVDNFDITVKDDGQGIGGDGLNYLGMVEATSKRNSPNSKYGFRGLALKAIKTVSKSFTITTRTKDETIGTKLTDGEKQLTSAPVGTTVEVKGLFHGIPVRMHYLQQNYTKQMASIKKIVQQLHFVNYKLRFELVLNGNIINYMPVKERLVVIIDSGYLQGNSESRCVWGFNHNN